MNETRKKVIQVIIIWGLIIVGIIATCVSAVPTEFKGDYTEYNCDVKIFNLATTINISKDNVEVAKVKGKLLKFITDPLSMYDSENNTIAYAGDAYHFIAQDSHTIYVAGEFSVEMLGLVDFFGESYDIYNIEQEKIASMSMNVFNTKGEIYDSEGNLIADFYSAPFVRDFKVRIADGCTIDHNTILMIFSSYYSDVRADGSA